MDNNNSSKKAQPFKSLLRCVSFCTASAYDLSSLAAFFRRKGYLTRLSRDTLHVASVKRPGDIFFFSYGCIVCWGFKKNFDEKLLEYVKAFSVHALHKPELDHFCYAMGENISIDAYEKLRLDIITLDSDDTQIKLAISYGLAQSIKLEAFEEAIQEAIRNNTSLTEQIAKYGAISLSRRAIFKRIGEIFIARSSINLNIEYLDAPEFFWRNPNLEPNYIMVKKYLDIQNRVMALNEKLNILQELLDILNGQVQHSHSSLLESIIIILILVEIAVSLFQFHVF